MIVMSCLLRINCSMVFGGTEREREMMTMMISDDLILKCLVYEVGEFRL